MTQTFIWTGMNGKKTPLHIMDDEYLKNCYRRCMEIVTAHKVDKKVDSFVVKDFELSVNLNAMWVNSPLTPEMAQVWVNRFITEAKRRKIRLPLITRHNIETRFKQRMFLKKMKKESNKRFDEIFKY